MDTRDLRTDAAASNLTTSADSVPGLAPDIDSPDIEAEAIGSEIVPVEAPLTGTVLPPEDVRPRQMIEVDRLRPHPGHVRRDLDLNQTFLASIANGGVDTPLLVVPAPDGPGHFWIVDGVRRWAGARKAGITQVPYDLDMAIAEDIGEQHLRAYRVNAEELTNTKSPFEQLQVLDLAASHGADRTRIRKALGMKAEEAKAALAAGRQLREPSQELTSMLHEVIDEVPDVEWTLDEAVLIAEFSDDENALRMIADYKLNGESVAYAVERIKRERARVAGHEKLLAALAETNVPITDDVPDSGLHLRDLRTGDGETAEEMTVAAHESCPGHGVCFESYGSNVPEARFYCADPEAYGHSYRSDFTAKKMKLRAELIAAGRTIANARPYGMARLDRLRDADGAPISVEDHLACPGAVVSVEGWTGDPQAYEYCADPVEHGHTFTETGSGDKPDKPDNVPPRAVVIEGNQAWPAAAVVRQDWLRTLCARKSAPKQVAPFVTRAVLKMPSPLHDALIGMSGDQMFEKITGRSVEKAQEELSALRDGRRMLLAFAKMAAAFEVQMSGDNTRRDTWRVDRSNLYCSREDAGRYLRLLIDLGYQPSPIERAVATGAPYLGDKVALAVGTAGDTDTGNDVQDNDQNNGPDDEAAAVSTDVDRLPQTNETVGDGISDTPPGDSAREDDLAA